MHHFGRRATHEWITVLLSAAVYGWPTAFPAGHSKAEHASARRVANLAKSHSAGAMFRAAAGHHGSLQRLVPYGQPGQECRDMLVWTRVMRRNQFELWVARVHSGEL